MKNKYFIGAAILVALFLYIKPTTADFRTEEDKVISLGDSLPHSIVLVTDTLGHGSGFYISPHEIITDEHVVHGLYNVTVLDKKGQQCPATVYYADPNEDLALLDTKCSGAPLTLATSVKVGQTVVMMGNPEDQQFFLSKGIVSNINKYYVGFDAISFSGDSGAPIVNLNSEVLGVTRFVYLGSPRAALATSNDTLKQFIATVAYLKAKEK